MSLLFSTKQQSGKRKGGETKSRAHPMCYGGRGRPHGGEGGTHTDMHVSTRTHAHSQKPPTPFHSSPPSLLRPPKHSLTHRRSVNKRRISPARIRIGDVLHLRGNFCKQGSQRDTSGRRLCQGRASLPENVWHRSQPFVQGIGGVLWRGVEGLCRLDYCLHCRGNSCASE